MERHKGSGIEKPVKFQCPAECKRVITTTNHNTVYKMYAHQPWFNHIHTVCKEDQHFNAIPINPDNEEMVAFARQFETQVERYCEDKSIIEAYKIARNIKPLEAHDITRRHENRIAFLRHELGRMSGSQVVNEMREPQPPKTLPGKWRDS